MKAKIGITVPFDSYKGKYESAPFYAQAIESSGGIPFMLPFMRSASFAGEIIDCLDGVLFSGGDNIDPRLYGENAESDCGKIEFERDLFELSLCRLAFEKNVPILGICRGCQLIAVSSGGTLFQHIDGHAQTSDRHAASHSVDVVRDTLLFDVINAERTDVNSFHTQSVKTTGGLKIAATCGDVIEAVCMPGKKFCLGVQWHPERMYSTDIHSKQIFDRFIDSCS